MVLQVNLFGDSLAFLNAKFLFARWVKICWLGTLWGGELPGSCRLYGWNSRKLGITHCHPWMVVSRSCSRLNRIPPKSIAMPSSADWTSIGHALLPFPTHESVLALDIFQKWRCWNPFFCRFIYVYPQIWLATTTMLPRLYAGEHSSMLG